MTSKICAGVAAMTRSTETESRGLATTQPSDRPESIQRELRSHVVIGQLHRHTDADVAGVAPVEGADQTRSLVEGHVGDHIRGQGLVCRGRRPVHDRVGVYLAGPVDGRPRKPGRATRAPLARDKAEATAGVAALQLGAVAFQRIPERLVQRGDLRDEALVGQSQARPSTAPYCTCDTPPTPWT